MEKMSEYWFIRFKAYVYDEHLEENRKYRAISEHEYNLKKKIAESAFYSDLTELTCEQYKILASFLREFIEDGGIVESELGAMNPGTE